MEISYDKEADAMYIKFVNRTFSKNKKIDDLEKNQNELEKEVKKHRLALEFWGATNAKKTQGNKEYWENIQKNARKELIQLALEDPKFMKSIQCTKEELEKILDKL